MFKKSPKKVFEGDLAHVKIKGTLVMVPSAKTLIEMKLKSVVNRNDAFKRTKDLVDLHGLLDSHKELLSAKPKIESKLLGPFRKKLIQFRTDGTIASAADLSHKNQYDLFELLEKL